MSYLELASVERSYVERRRMRRYHSAEEFLAKVFNSNLGASMNADAILANAPPIFARSLPQWGVLCAVSREGIIAIFLDRRCTP
jgi:hypothetical protein